MLIAFSNSEGIVHCEFVLGATTVNAAYYVEVLSCLQDKVRRKLPEKLCNGLILHHTNTASHRAMAVQQFLVEKQIALMLQPLYLTDFAPCDF
jgi:hypothetical protein